MLERAKNHLRNPLSAYLGLILVCMLLLVAIAAVLPGCTSQDVTPQTQTSGIVYDENAIEGGWEQMSQEEIEETLNETVSEGMIRISMNTTPVFEDGDAEGNLMIVNETVKPLSPAGGDLPQRHQGDHLRIQGHSVGSKIEKAALDVHLEAGTYACTALFHSLDPETGSILGTAGAVITITHQSLRQHRTIWQEYSAKDFVSYESIKGREYCMYFPLL